MLIGDLYSLGTVQYLQPNSNDVALCSQAYEIKLYYELSLKINVYNNCPVLRLELEALFSLSAWRRPVRSSPDLLVAAVHQV